MRTSGVPDHILRRLERLKDQSVLGKDKFLERLKEALGGKDMEAHQSIILKYADDPLHESVEYGDPTGIEIAAEKTTYFVGEPIYLSLTLSNDRDRPAKWDFYPGLTGGVRIDYRKAGGKLVKYYPEWLQRFLEGMGGGISAPPVIPAYGKQEGTVKLFYDSAAKNFVLAEPGEYEFKATLATGEHQRLESQTVQVRVAEPSQEDRVALATLSDPELVQFVEGDINMSANPTQAGVVAEKAAVFLEKYPQSIYAPTVERMLRFNLEEAERVPTRMTPKLKALSQWLRERR
jgi:hypothetical protein